MKYEIKVEKIRLYGESIEFSIQGVVKDIVVNAKRLPKPRLVLYFDNGKETRRIPFPFASIVTTANRCSFYGTYAYSIPNIFWRTREENLPTNLCFNFWQGEVYEEKAPVNLSQVDISSDGVLYEVSLNPDEEGCVRITPSSHRINKGVFKVFRKGIEMAFGFLGTLLGAVLIPWFLIEALLTFIGIGQLDSKIVTDVKIRRVIGHVNRRFSSFASGKIKLKKLYRLISVVIFALCKVLYPLKKNQIAFISHRRNDLTGNFAFVQNVLAQDKDLEMVYFLNTKRSVSNPIEVFKMCKVAASSKVILLDEFTPQIHRIDLRKQTKLFQLWHATGAFKTFGFSRIDKPKGSPQSTRNHRNYDYVTVSSSYCIKCHSEGFGVDDHVIVPTGIPRTDVFFDEEYKARVRQEFYEKYPQLKDKRIILFAPTFRGMLKGDAYYPFAKFDVGKIMANLSDDDVLIIKHHPFVTKKHPVPAEYQDRVYDFSDDVEINDLLLITDLIISDYSSLVFEAALIKIPMIFYVFDYVQYVRERDFYFDLDVYAPGKLVTTQQEIIDAIKNNDFNEHKIAPFAEMFFDHQDGNSTQRVVDLIYKALRDE